MTFCQVGNSSAFATSGKASVSFGGFNQGLCTGGSIDQTYLYMAAESGGQRKRRKRKQPPKVKESTPIPAPIVDETPVVENSVVDDNVIAKTDESGSAGSSFKFDAAEAAALGKIFILFLYKFFNTFNEFVKWLMMISM